MGALPRSLADWLAYLETRHPVTQIVLGLERVGTVAARRDAHEAPGAAKAAAPAEKPKRAAKAAAAQE